MKFLTFILALTLTIGLIACSEDNKDETQTDENQPQENVQNTPQNNNQQGFQGNQQQQMQQNQQIPTNVDTSKTKPELKTFLKKMVIWVESSEYMTQLRKTIQPGQNQQQSMAERKIMDEMFFNLLKKSGFPNSKSFEYTLRKYQQEEDIKIEFDKLSAAIGTKMKIIQADMMPQQQGNQQNLQPKKNSN